MTHQCRMGWAGAAALVADELPGRPALRSPDPLRFSVEQMKARKALDVPPTAAPYVTEHAAIAGRVLWASEKREISTTTASPQATVPTVFKKGDRVRGIGGCGKYWKHGDVGTVDSVEGLAAVSVWVKWDGNTEEDGIWCALTEKLEHIQPSDTQQWVEWKGGERPVPANVHVEYRMRDGWSSKDTRMADGLRWTHRDWPGDIVAYRVVQ